ncbi:SAM-dependent methyltransferase [Pseudothauera nasutitermitis]|nr:methyltransferase domain-containing protein [Pseudothauera nasutitermitis]
MDRSNAQWIFPLPVTAFRPRRRGFNRMLGAGLAACILGGLARPARAQGVHLDVPYVPTPHEVVEAMLELAGVQPGERVTDLGCGDGRMVVTAASQFGAHGLGVDIDPERIREARANAAEAGVADKVEFRVGDLFEVDLRDTDVLAIYLLEEINLRLRPVILAQMRPGARVVSHAFSMGPWRPDREELILGRRVFLWTVPAQAGGRWRARHNGREFTLTLEQDYQILGGSAAFGPRSAEVRDGRVSGSEVAFTLEVVPGSPELLRGRIDGERIVALDGGAVWSAERLAR